MTDKVRAGPIETPKRRADRAAAQQKAQDGPDQRAGRQRVHGALGNHALSTLLSGNAPAPGGAPSSVEALHAALRQAQQGRHPASGRAAQPLQRSQPPGEALNFQVSKPADPAERAAEATAQRLLQGAGASERPAPVVDRTTPPAPAPTTGQGVPAPTATTIRNPGAGQPLSPLLRHQLETPLRMELSAVRVHSGPGAAEAARSLGARAFTHGSDIFLGPGESAQDTRLMAHEVTHVVQQTSAPAATPGIQRDLADDLASAAGAVADLGSSAVDTVSEAAGEVVEMGAEYFWSLVEELAPQFAPILREISDKGILTYFGDLIRESFGSIFDSLSADPGVIGALTSTFLELFASAQTILTALASGDCGPLFAAVTQLKETVSQMAGDAWNAITEFFQPVGDFFSNLWQQFGAPLVDWLTAMAGDLWEWIQNLGTQIWEWTAPVRDTLMAAWEWVTEQLFGHEDPQGNSEGGLVNLITDMAGQAWDAIKAEVEPVIAPIRSFAESVMALLPLDAILNLRETVQGWLSGVQNMTQNMSQPQDVATNQGSLREILPGVLASIATLRDGIVAAGQWVATQVGSVAETVNGFFASLSSISLLSPLSGAISWVQETVTSLSSWAQETVAGLFTSIGDGLVYLSQFIEPVVSMLQQLVSLVTDLMGILPNFIAGIWNRIPACIREPIQQFIVDNILSQIPIFAQILQIPDIWARISQTVMTILRQVFVDGNLAGAAWTFFQALLSVLGIPPELVVNIISKAAAVIGDILGDPVGFFLNLLRAVKQGFVNFFGNIGRHLLGGVTGWLFDELQRANIRPPADLSLGSIISFVLEVLGITVDNFFDRLGRRIGPERAQRIRRMVDLAVGALRWVYRLVTEGPGALWQEIQSQLSNLWNMALNAIIGWLTSEVIDRATVRLLSMLDPTGIMAVVNSIIALYNAIQSFVQYMRQILEVVNTVLDGLGGIARGALEQAAGFLENGLVRILPIAIGFLANQVGLSGLGRRIGEMIETVREYVNRGIDWLINTSINALNALLGRGEEEEESGDVRTAAQNRLQRELRAEHSIDEVRAILSRTLSDLQTRGLRRLELGAANEDGSYAIIAEASPAADLMRIIPKVEEAEGASVRVFARLTLEGSSDAFGAEDVQRTVAPTDEQVRQFIAATYGPISDPAQFLAAQQQARQALSTTATVTQPTGAGVDVSAGPQTSPQRRQHGAQLAPRPYWLVGRSTEAAHGRSQHGGAVFEPAEGSNTVEGVFWSLGKLDLGRIGDNSTHAEAQFIEWYEQRLAESVRRRVRRIELQIDPYSPCWTCSGALVGFINRARQNGPITASLTWSKPYLNPANRPGERSGGQTTPSSLGDLISAQWSVQPASLPQSETEGEAGYIVAST